MLGVGATLRHIATKGSGSNVPVPFAIADLFANGEDGVYYDPSIGGSNIKSIKNYIPKNGAINQTPWIPVNCTITDGISDPFGGTGAFRITDNSSNATHMPYSPAFEVPNSGYVTMSCYVKAESITGLRITYQDSQFLITEITNLDGTPTLSQTSNRALTDVGGGWYLFTHKFYKYTSNYGNFYIMTMKNGAFAYSGTGESAVIYAPQINIAQDSFPDFSLKINTGTIDSDFLSEYPSHNLYESAFTSPVIYYGAAVGGLKDSSGNNNNATQNTSADRPILVNNPSSGRRNILSKSEFLNWSETNIDSGIFETQSAGAQDVDDHLTDPDGNENATFLTVSGNVNQAKISNTQYLKSGHYWFTAYVKKPTVDGVSYVYLTSGNNSTWFNLSTAIVGHDEHSDSFVTSAGNGWYRIGVKDNHGSNSDVSLKIGLSDSDNSQSATDGKQVHYYGVQLESGATYTNMQRVIQDYYVTESGFGDITGLQCYDANHLDMTFTSSASPFTFIAAVDHVKREFFGTYSYIYAVATPFSLNKRHANDARVGYTTASGSNYGTADAFDKQVITYPLYNNDHSIRVNGTVIYTDTSQSEIALTGTSTLGGGTFATSLNGVVYQFLIRKAQSSASEIASAESRIGAKTGEAL